MPNKILTSIVKNLVYLIVFISFSVQSQQDDDIPTFENNDVAPAVQIDMPESGTNTMGAADQEPEITVNEELPPEPIEEQASDDENASQTEGGAVRSGNFDVFRPSEEISEDLAVPFPADI
tara:strand:- start:108 stop:470 length:363 start_codon:yes stop_codon:yes gene_type:complete